MNNGPRPEAPRYDGHRAIWIQRFDPDDQKVVGPRSVLVDGGVDPSTNPVWIEGPHIFKHDGHYYLFLNRWDWEHANDPSLCGTYLAVSDDLVRWEHRGLVFPKAHRIHRNATVVQDPDNRPVRGRIRSG